MRIVITVTLLSLFIKYSYCRPINYSRTLRMSAFSNSESSAIAQISVDSSNKVDTLLSKRPSNGLLIYKHVDCYGHNIPDHPEQPNRMTAILDILTAKYDEGYFREAPLATKEQLELFHTPKHVSIINNIGSVVEEAHANKKYAFKQIDGDTVMMWNTRNAALRAVGAVIQAVDDVFSEPFESGKIKTAFCCVRPPGHHAERNRAMGFCFFNNVGVAAKYAQMKYGLSRVAVVDFDVHHGNGSEEGFREFETLFFGSTHEKDNYPGTGSDPTPFIGENVKNPIHRRIVNRYLNSGQQSRGQFRQKWKEIIDEMILFRPELIIISAGFDAHAADELSGTMLIEEDYAWATEIVVHASRTINADNPPAIISSLEGGYNLKHLAMSAAAHVDVLARSNELPLLDALDNKESVENHGGDEVAALADHLKSLDI